MDEGQMTIIYHTSKSRKKYFPIFLKGTCFFIQPRITNIEGRLEKRIRLSLLTARLSNSQKAAYLCFSHDRIY